MVPKLRSILISTTFPENDKIHTFPKSHLYANIPITKLLFYQFYRIEIYFKKFPSQYNTKREKKHEMDFIKIKHFCSLKNAVKRMKKNEKQS